MVTADRMVDEQIAARGIDDPRVLAAMRKVPRDRFVPAESRHEAYEDHPIPIGFGQTISQPYIVAFMTEALRLEPGSTVLEIGVGSGYQSAVLAEIAAKVYGVEIVEPLASRAAGTLAALGYTNVHLRVGDGNEGWPEHAPYDRVLVAASAPGQVPPSLIEQLRDGGIIVIPVGEWNQDLHVLRKRGAELETLATIGVRFVPLVTGKDTRDLAEDGDGRKARRETNAKNER
jgi:protein-L-isoaspartate(D-aspartate) O-methyltransferase